MKNNKQESQDIEVLLNEEFNKLKSAVEYIESAKDTATKFELQIVAFKAMYDEEVGKNTEQILNLERKIEATQEKLSNDFTDNFKALNNLFSGNPKSILTEIDKELKAVQFETKEVSDNIQLSQKPTQKPTQKLSEIEAKLEAHTTEKQRLNETVKNQLTNFDSKIEKIIENNYKKSTEFQKTIAITQSSLNIFSNERKELKEALLEEQKLRKKLQKTTNFSLAVAIIALLTSLFILAILALKWYL
jgi:predicted  nucleic acid-binding Zn-ribbon protein